MTIDDIKALISSDESRTLELNKTTGELKDGIHAACAFLNTEGGWLIFGIAPKSLKIIGRQVTDDTKREIAQALAGLQPAVDMRPDYVDAGLAFCFKRWDGAFVYVTFKRPTKVAPDTSKDNLGGNDALSNPQASPKSPPQAKLLTEKMGDSYMTMKEIAELCGISDLKYFRKSYISPALEIGVIERLYPNHPKHTKQKYHLTENANEWKSLNNKSKK